MKFFILSLASFFLLSSTASANNGLITLKSSYSVKVTADRLENILKNKGMKIFTRIDHSEGAKSIGEELNNTELIIFGNPATGTQLMKCQQSVAIDLPLKALIWEDKEGKIWLTYNSPKYLVNRHNISGCDEVINKIDKAVSNFAKQSTTSD